MQHAEEENTSDVAHERQPPRKQSRDSAALSAKILSAQQEFEMVLNNQAIDQCFNEKLKNFLIHVGYLMGYTSAATAEEAAEEEDLEEIDQELEEANAVASI